MTNYMKRFGLGVFALSALVTLSGCATINLGPQYEEPFKEQVIQAPQNAKAKVLLLEVTGMISDEGESGLLSSGPSLLDKVMMQLARAEQDPAIKTVLLKVNSPGGGVTTSDILYHEIVAFKKRTGKKVFVQMMDVAASGGYYLSMAADHVQAHPTTVTGSVGAIVILPNVTGLADKIGVKVQTYKTGKYKDVGSPFKQPNAEDDAFTQNLTDQMVQRFYQIVQDNRGLSNEQMVDVKTARVYTGWEAKKSGLIDSLGYLSDATKKACLLGGQKVCQLVTYRFQGNANAGIYSPTLHSNAPSAEVSLIKAKSVSSILNLKSGAYYLYLP